MAITMGPNGVIFSDGTTQAPTNVADAGDLISVTSYASGTNTYTVPSGCTQMFVRVQGGGGGSAGYLESGGAGGYAEVLIDVRGAGLTAGTSTITATVGGGGGGVGYYAAATDGGTSSFGSYCSATGGYGANRNYSHTGGAGGLGTGQVHTAGGGGSGHGNSHGYAGMGRGGASYFGGPHGVRHSGYEQIGPGAPGAGASGGTTDNGGTGRTGANGLVIIYAYK
jgi:hypothetical protein